MMNIETRIAIINKEIEVYQSYLNLIPVIEKVIKKFDNKCINKKFQTALDEAVNDGEKQRKFYISTEYGYEGCFIIVVHAYDANVIEKTDKDYCSTYRVYNDTHNFRFPKENFEITDSGNYRINADEMIKTMYEKSAVDLYDSMIILETGLKQADEMISEMKRIKAELEAFEKKYSYHMRDIMGVNFTLRDNTSYEYRNYDI